MLALTRKRGESIVIGNEITVKLIEVLAYGRAKIGIEAPPALNIRRAELAPRDHLDRPRADPARGELVEALRGLVDVIAEDRLIPETVSSMRHARDLIHKYAKENAR